MSVSATNENETNPHHVAVVPPPSPSKSLNQHERPVDQTMPPDTVATNQDEAEQEEEIDDFKPDKHFWILISSLLMSTFLSALDLSCIAIALPKIASELNGSNSYLWVGSAYALTSTALIPWAGSLAFVFGRKPILMASVFIFAVGSATCGAAKNMTTMIAGRSVQGIGGGGIMVLCIIVLVDIVPLARRGPFFGVLGSVWALATTIGPPLSGGLATRNQWRWLFWMNLPIAALALVLIFCFLDVKKPKTTLREKFQLMDWYNLIFVGSATSVVLALSWAGTQHAWDSAAVLAPLIVGFGGIAFFIWIDQRAKYPTVPLSIISNRTTIGALFLAFCQSMVLMIVVYYFGPAYFQAAKSYSAVHSGVCSLPLSFFVAPSAILIGIVVNKIKVYRWPLFIGTCIMAIGAGLLVLLTAGSPTGLWVILCIIFAIGLGILQTGVMFPLLAPLPVNSQPSAIALSNFVKAFGQVVGIAVGGVILQNELHKTLPEDFIARYPAGQELAFSVIPSIPSLPEPLLSQVQDSFSDAMRAIFYFCMGISLFCIIVAFFLRDYELHKTTDKEWGLENKEKKGGDEEMVLSTSEKK